MSFIFMTHGTFLIWHPSQIYTLTIRKCSKFKCSERAVV